MTATVPARAMSDVRSESLDAQQPTSRSEKNSDRTSSNRPTRHGPALDPKSGARIVSLPLEEAASDPERVYVPGYGWVDWSEPLLDAQARYLSLIHRPAPQRIRYRMRWLVVPVREAERQRCRFCGQEWQCAESAWATARLTPAARTRTRGRRAAGKHRASWVERVLPRTADCGTGSPSSALETG